MATPTLSIIILAKNCQESIARTLESCGFADEVLVIDDFSTDNTPTVAIEHGARVLRHELNGDFSAQRNFGIEHACCDWILFIDADEVITPELQKEIQRAVQKDPKAYLVRRSNRFQHHRIEHGSMRSDVVLRLAPKGKIFVAGKVHEKIDSPLPKEELPGRLLHYPYDSWSVTIRKLDAYTSYLAEQQETRGKKTGFWAGAVIKPTWAFFKVYALNGGFLDGKMGFLFSVHHAYYTFMKYAKWDLVHRTNGKL